MKKIIVPLTIAVLSVLSGCDKDIVQSEESAYDDTLAVIDTVTVDSSVLYNTPKYVFLFVGDGMALPQINATEAALGMGGAHLRSVGISALNITQFPIIGSATTFAEDRYITGSAAAATALPLGMASSVNVLSLCSKCS